MLVMSDDGHENGARVDRFDSKIADVLAREVMHLFTSIETKE